MRSAELLQQPACGGDVDRRSIRIDDEEPGRDAGVDPDRASARLTACSGESVELAREVHVACVD